MTEFIGLQPVTREFLARDVLDVAPELLGCVLERTDGEGRVAIRITEIEAYAGERDPGAHSYRGQTKRNSTMFGPAGHIYCYFTYGMHHALNLVVGLPNQPYGCLVRAGEIIAGTELARARREARPHKTALPDWALARGPGNVAQSFGANLTNDGDSLFDGQWRLFVPADGTVLPHSTGPRVGVSGPGGDGAAFPWRYWLPDAASVSAYKARRVQRARAQSADTQVAIAPDVIVRRVYDEPERQDGIRVLVDRLWPRGMTKERAALDVWCKSVAPSAELRRWYGHDPEKFGEFAERYEAELGVGDQATGLQHLRDLATGQRLTLLTATKDASISEAAVLADILSR